MRPSGDGRVDIALAAIGALIIFIAAVNFVTLMTARATRRAIEVGVRKASGASRSDLMVQFMGEAMLYVIASALLGVLIAELALPYFNAFFDRNIRLDWIHDPKAILVVAGLTVLVGGLAGIYPALVLSAFRPAEVLKGSKSVAGSGAVRQALVIVQFSILVALIALTATIFRQTMFALRDGVRLDTDQVIQIDLHPCEPGFRDAVAHLAGVKGAACSTTMPGLLGRTAVMGFRPGDAKFYTLSYSSVDVGYFELQGLNPRAGHFFSRLYGEDVLLDRQNATPDDQPSVIVNETAVHALRFNTPEQAVGRTISWTRVDFSQPSVFPKLRPSQIVGVVPDFTLGSVKEPIEPVLYFVSPPVWTVLNVKLSGRDIPETLARIDDLWRATGHTTPMERHFEDQQIQHLYDDVIREGATVALCTALAIVIACLGLFALASFTTERRTTEIGVRKAMGADSLDIVLLLLWKFTVPVLWANVIAWPLAWWATNRWLHGFAYRVDLPLWVFIGSSAIGVLVAWATVGAQTFLVARAKPITALRYE